MNKKHSIFIYPLTGKVVFPYHEYRFALSSRAYNRTPPPTQPTTTTTSSGSSAG